MSRKSKRCPHWASEVKSRNITTMKKECLRWIRIQRGEGGSCKRSKAAITNILTSKMKEYLKKSKLKKTQVTESTVFPLLAPFQYSFFIPSFPSLFIPFYLFNFLLSPSLSSDSFRLFFSHSDCSHVRKYKLSIFFTILFFSFSRRAPNSCHLSSTRARAHT